MKQSVIKIPDTGDKNSTSIKPCRQQDNIDGGYGWIIVLAGFMIHVILDGTIYSFGIIYVELLDEFQQGKGQTSLVSSLIPGIVLATGVISSSLIGSYGSRKTTIVGSLISSLGFIASVFAPNIYYLYVSFGVVSGFGFGLVLLSSIVSIGHYFKKRRSFAMGLTVCGAGFGTFIYSPIINALIEGYGWRGAVLIMAGILLNTAVGGALLRPHYTTRLNIELDPKGKVDDQNLSKIMTCCSIVNLKKHINFSHLQNGMFLLYVISNTFAVFGIRSIHMFLPDRAEGKGISKIDASYLLSVFGISNIVGRLFFGWLADTNYVSRLTLYCLSLIITGLATIVNPLNDSLGYLMSYSAIYGVFAGVYMCMYAVVLVDIVGIDNMTSCLGLLWMFRGIATILGPPIAGWISDGTNNYDVAFYVLGSILVLGGLLGFFIPKLQLKGMHSTFLSEISVQTDKTECEDKNNL